MKKRHYDLKVEVIEADGNVHIKRYDSFKKIRFIYNKSAKTLRAVLISDSGSKIIVELINVIAVTRTRYKL